MSDTGYRWASIDDNGILQNTFSRIWIMAVGSLPTLIVAGLLIGVRDMPTFHQLVGVGYVAISTGVIATSLFLYARQNIARTGDEISAVDSTQSFEVPFALMFEVLFLGATLPNLIGWIGMVAVVVGVSGYVFSARN
jgi:drug/metabolite transporter (DMT)-like permease